MGKAVPKLTTPRHLNAGGSEIYRDAYVMNLCTWLFASGVLSALIATLVYWNTLNCGIVYDDEPAIKKNMDLRPQASWTGLLYHDFWGASIDSKTSHKSYRPLCVATFKLNYLLHELQPMGYHLVNVLLHGAVCYLYVQLCGVVFSGAVWPALIAGLLFAVHPIHTEAVAGLVGRTELLSGIFYTMSFLFYHRAALSQNILWMGGVVLSCLCAVLSKEQGITVVGVCLVYEFFLLHKMTLVSGLKLLRTVLVDRHSLPPWFTGFVARAGILATFSVVFLVGRVWLMKGGPDIFNRSINPPLYMDTPSRQLSWLYLTFVNSWLLLNPTHLCADWRYRLIPLIHSITDPHNILSAVTLATVVGLAFYGAKGTSKQSRILVVGLAMAVVPFLPASNLFFPVGFVVAERVLYLPSMGFCMLVAYGAYTVHKSASSLIPRTLIKLSVFSLLLLMAAHTVNRNQVWESNLTLYTSGVRCNPENGVMLTNLGIEHGRLRNYSFAEKLYRTSIQVAPDHSKGYSNLGGLLEALKRYDEAEEVFRKSIELGVADSTGQKVIETIAFLIDNVILRNGSHRLNDALELVNQALVTYPRYARLFAMKGVLLYKLNQTKTAVEFMEVASKSGYRSIDLLYHLGLAYESLGEDGKAEEMFGSTLRLDGSHTDAMYHLGVVIYKGAATAAGKDKAKKLQESGKYLHAVLSAKPNHADSLHALGMVHFDLENYGKAKEMFENVLKSTQARADSLYGLAKTLIKIGDRRTAAAKLKALLKIDKGNSKAKELLRSLEKH